jgi:hypothetical protein
MAHPTTQTVREAASGRPSQAGNDRARLTERHRLPPVSLL